MRIITDAALTAISQAEALEPINYIDINWNRDGVTFIRYSDQNYPGMIGIILELSGLENVVNIAGNSSSQNLTVKLDDTDGDIKAIIDNHDIHKATCRVGQTFKSIDIGDGFQIFEGEINSPMVWNENERSFTFDIVSMIESVEIGFSAEEGDFNYVPAPIVGRAWPIIFGAPLHVPAIRLQDIPSGATSKTIGVDSKGVTVTNQIAAYNKALGLAKGALVAAIRALAAAQYYEFKQVTDVEMPPPDLYTGANYTSLIEQLYKQADTANKQANQYISQANQIAQHMYTVTGGRKPSGLQNANFPVIGGGYFPQGVTTAVNVIGVGGASSTLTGAFSGSTFSTITASNPLTDVGIINAGPIQIVENGDIATNFQQQTQEEASWVAAGGSTITFDVTTVWPISYIASLGWNTVLQVWAKRNLPGGYNALYPVPQEYYSVSYEAFGSEQIGADVATIVNATFVTMIRPLSVYPDSGWENEIFVDFYSPIGPNVVDIMIWLIENYTNHTYDQVSFTHVRAMVDAYPANFAITTRKDIMVALQEIAFQSRCAIWFNNGMFYLRYLSEQTEPTETFVDDDIEFGSLIMESTKTEEVVTKSTCTWRPDYYENEFVLVFRANISNYGVMEQKYDYYIYNWQQLVEKSAVFWMIRKSNVWKRVTFDTFLTKLRVETYDMILLDFSEPIISNEPVVAMVESAKYDSANQRITITCWVPIRWGELIQYPYGLPATLSETVVYPVPKDNPYPGALGDLYNQYANIGNASAKSTRPNSTTGGFNPYDAAGNQYITQPGQAPPYPTQGDSGDSAAAYAASNANPYPDPTGSIDTSIPNGVNLLGTSQQWQVKDPPPVIQPYATSGVYPGYIVANNNDGTYSVNIYPNGLNGDPVLVSVKELSGNTVANGLGVVVTKNVSQRTTDDDGNITDVTEYSMSVSTQQSVIPGKVNSGTGATYQVDLYENGWDTDSTRTVTCTQLDIDPSETIDPGTVVMVLSMNVTTPDDGSGDGPTTGIKFYMQIPVWLPATS